MLNTGQPDDEVLARWDRLLFPGVDSDALGAEVIQQAFQPAEKPVVSAQIPCQELVVERRDGGVFFLDPEDAAEYPVEGV